MSPHRRDLTSEELVVLRDVHAYWGPQNLGDNVFFTDRDEAAILRTGFATRTAGPGREPWADGVGHAPPRRDPAPAIFHAAAYGRLTGRLLRG